MISDFNSANRKTYYNILINSNIVIVTYHDILVYTNSTNGLLLIFYLLFKKFYVTFYSVQEVIWLFLLIFALRNLTREDDTIKLQSCYLVS